MKRITLSVLLCLSALILATSCAKEPVQQPEQKPVDEVSQEVLEFYDSLEAKIKEHFGDVPPETRSDLLQDKQYRLLNAATCGAYGAAMGGYNWMANSVTYSVMGAFLNQKSVGLSNNPMHVKYRSGTPSSTWWPSHRNLDSRFSMHPQISPSSHVVAVSVYNIMKLSSFVVYNISSSYNFNYLSNIERKVLSSYDFSSVIPIGGHNDYYSNPGYIREWFYGHLKEAQGNFFDKGLFDKMKALPENSILRTQYEFLSYMVLVPLFVKTKVEYYEFFNDLISNLFDMMESSTTSEEVKRYTIFNITGLVAMHYHLHSWAIGGKTYVDMLE